MKWKTLSLGELSTSIQPGPFGSQLHSSDYTEEGTPIIMPKDMVNGKVSHSSLMFVPEDCVSRLRRHQVAKGDLMVARKGDVRKCIYISEAEDGWLTGSDCLKVTLNKEQCEPRFVYYQLRSEYIGRWLEKISIGATMPSLNTGLLRGIELFIPPISIQRKIADILSAYDDLIGNNQKRIKLLEEAAQRLYKEWFVDLHFPGHEDAKIVDGVPEGWRFCKLDEVFDYVRGKSYKSEELSEEEGVLMVNLKNIRAFGGYNRNQEKRFTGKYKDSQIVRGGDVVMGITDMTKERRLVGHVALIPELGEKMTFSMDLIKLIPKMVSNYFLYSTMYFGKFSEKISPLANGTNVLHLKPEAMMSLETLVPDKRTLDAYDRLVKPILKEIESLQNQCSFASEARDRLLPKLMSGEIEV